VKKRWFLVIAGTALACGSVNADMDDDVYAGEQMIDSSSEGDDRPFSISFRQDYIQKAKVHKDGLDGNVKYHDSEIEASAVFYYNAEHHEGAIASVAYTDVHFDWNANPYFDQKRFHQATFSLAGFTRRLDNWMWQLQASMNWDTRHRDFNHYTNYDLVLWGRYEIDECTGFHVGLLAQTGMKIDKTYPIIGMDYQINENWQLNLVLPMNVSLIYTINENWTTGVVGRFFDIRRRVGKDQPLPEALLEYRNIGLEYALNYSFDKWLALNVHIGESFGGKFKISNKHHKHGHHFKYDGAAYFGSEIVAKF
jgi:hypothetical protein